MPEPNSDLSTVITVGAGEVGITPLIGKLGALKAAVRSTDGSVANVRVKGDTRGLTRSLKQSAVQTQQYSRLSQTNQRLAAGSQIRQARLVNKTIQTDTLRSQQQTSKRMQTMTQANMRLAGASSVSAEKREQARAIARQRILARGRLAEQVRVTSQDRAQNVRLIGGHTQSQEQQRIRTSQRLVEQGRIRVQNRNLIGAQTQRQEQQRIAARPVVRQRVVDTQRAEQARIVNQQRIQNRNLIGEHTQRLAAQRLIADPRNQRLTQMRGLIRKDPNFETTIPRYRQQFQLDTRQARQEIAELHKSGDLATQSFRNRTYYRGKRVDRGFRPQGPYTGDALTTGGRDGADPPRRPTARASGDGGIDRKPVAGGVGARKRPQRTAGALFGLGATQAQFITATYAIRRFSTALLAVPTAAAIAISVIGGIASNIARSFEQAFVGVRKTVDGTNLELDDVKESIIQSSFNVPIRFEELARGAQIAGQLGVPLGDIKDRTELFAKLEKATEIPIAQSAPLLSKAANILNIPGRNIENLASAIVHLGNTTIATEREMLPTMERISYWTRQMGFTPGEIAGLSAATVSSALRPQQAEAAFRGLTQEIFTPALSGDKSVLTNVHKIIQAGLGDQVISQEDVMQRIKERPAEFFSLLQGGFKEYHKQGQLDSEPVLLKFFEQIGIDNTREQSALARLFTASVDLNDILQSGQSAYETNIALQNEYNKAIDTFDSDVIRAGSSWSAMMDTIGTPFNERLRPIIKLFGSMFQGVRGNLKLLTDPRASQRFRNAPEDQQTIQDRLDRWNALSGRFRTVLDKFFEPFVNFTAVRNAANTAEEFGNSIAHLAERMTPFGQKLIKGFGSLTKTIADNPKLLEFGIRFTGIALAFTLIGGAVLSFLALLSGPAGILAIFGLLATGAFALKGTFSDTGELIKKTAEEMSAFELIIKSLVELLGLTTKPLDEPTLPKTLKTQGDIDDQYTEDANARKEDFDKFMQDPKNSLWAKFDETIAFGIREAYFSAQKEGKKLTVLQADETGSVITNPAGGGNVERGVKPLLTGGTYNPYGRTVHSIPYEVPGREDMSGRKYDPMHDTYYDSSRMGLSDLVEPIVDPVDPVSFDVPAVADDDESGLKLATIVPVDPDSLVKTVVQLASLNDPTVVGSDDGTDIGPVLGPKPEPAQLPFFTFPTAVQPDATFHDDKPTTPVIVQTGDKTANVSLTWSGDSGDLEELKTQFKQILTDFEYDARETDPGETT